MVLVLQELPALAALQIPAGTPQREPGGHSWPSCCDPALSPSPALTPPNPGMEDKKLSVKGVNHSWFERFSEGMATSDFEGRCVLVL